MTIPDIRTDKKSLYKRLSNQDILSKLQAYLRTNRYIVRPDGRIDTPIKSTSWDSPWVHTSASPDSECALLHRIVFECFNMVPSTCFNCWKVVVECRNIHELFQLLELQQKMGRRSKCGMELRYTDRKKFGGYFYNRSKEDGEECYLAVREAIDREIETQPGDGPVPVILKNACTEFELKFGPVCDWEVTQDQIDVEQLIKDWVVSPQEMFTQSPPVIIHIMRKWIHHAYHLGDPTVDMYIEEPLYKSIKTYHQDIGGQENGKVSE